MSDDSQRPIVVKRIRKGGGGHHGGAWKIAYADFVTAMMAFFLLMWLLGSTTSGDLKGISEFFATPLKVALTGGSGSGDSSSVIHGGGQDLTRAYGQVKRGETESPDKAISLKALKAELAAREKKVLGQLKEKIEKVFEKPKLASYRKQIRLDITSEGLRIQIVDEKNRPMFDLASSEVKPYMREILWEIGYALNDVPNKIALSGHTDAKQYASGGLGFSNWELSVNRANSSRRELIAGGMDDSKVLRVVGLAATVLFKKDDPYDPSNRRISILVLNKQAEEAILRDGALPEKLTTNNDLPDEGGNELPTSQPASQPVPATEVPEGQPSGITPATL